MRSVAALLAILVAAAGCSAQQSLEASGDRKTPTVAAPTHELLQYPVGQPSCDLALRQDPGRDFALAPAFQGTPESIADRFARALGSTLDRGTHEESSSDSGLVRHSWHVIGLGTIKVVTDYAGNRDWEVEYRADQGGYDRHQMPSDEAERQLESFLGKLQLPPEVQLAFDRYPDANVSEIIFSQQLPDGQQVRISFGNMVRVDPEGLRAVFMHPVYCFPRNAPALNHSLATQMAFQAADGFLKQEGREANLDNAHTDLRLRDDRLVYETTVWDTTEKTGCGHLGVEVRLSAMTGDVLNTEYAGIACPEV